MTESLQNMSASYAVSCMSFCTVIFPNEVNLWKDAHTGASDIRVEISVRIPILIRHVGVIVGKRLLCQHYLHLVHIQ